MLKILLGRVSGKNNCSLLMVVSFLFPSLVANRKRAFFLKSITSVLTCNRQFVLIIETSKSTKELLNAVTQFSLKFSMIARGQFREVKIFVIHLKHD